MPAGDLRNILTPILGITAAVCLLLAACALLGWLVPGSWLRGLIVTGVVASIALQVAWLSGWAVLPLAVDAALLWLVFGLHLTAAAAGAGTRPCRARGRVPRHPADRGGSAATASRRGRARARRRHYPGT